MNMCFEENPVVTMPKPAVADPGCDLLTEKPDSPPTANAQPRPKQRQAQRRARKQAAPPLELREEWNNVIRLAGVFTIADKAKTFTEGLDQYILEKGPDAYSEFVIGVVQATLGKMIVLLCSRCDVEQAREGGNHGGHPIAIENREIFLPMLEKLNTMFMKNERDRSAAQHARKMGAAVSTPVVPAGGQPC